ncbi:MULTISPECIES: acyl carrier protein [unclassified Pseudomonas]|uniref:acyl carrier protein n=1 Tax=unclassified Pseudomonas TaxID=196821 RepID=UPI000482610B|nr:MULTISPECIES: acyl carrier protein [unclassified Pseudomonas]MBV7564463.1 acyl carrier protein [Pseudomonas sp. sia0905]PZW69620.1 acyl carrier protein [Pseudomonas sp. URMO17WK12:I1]
MLTEEQVKAAMRAAGVSADIDAIGLNDKFSESGLDSLDVFNLLIELQADTGQQVPDKDVPLLESIAAIINYFKP